MGADTPPSGLRWCAITLFIVATVAVGLFIDLFFYGLIVPILPIMFLFNRMDLPEEKVQSYVNAMLAPYAGACVISSSPTGVICGQSQDPASALPERSGCTTGGGYYAGIW